MTSTEPSTYLVRVRAAASALITGLPPHSPAAAAFAGAYAVARARREEAGVDDLREFLDAELEDPVVRQAAQVLGKEGIGTVVEQVVTRWTTIASHGRREPDPDEDDVLMLGRAVARAAAELMLADTPDDPAAVVYASAYAGSKWRVMWCSEDYPTVEDAMVCELVEPAVVAAHASLRDTGREVIGGWVDRQWAQVLGRAGGLVAAEDVACAA